MILKIIAIVVFIGVVLFIAAKESKRNDKYNQTKLEDEKNSSNDDYIDTHY